jgi:hypothetical protein
MQPSYLAESVVALSRIFNTMFDVTDCNFTTAG